VRNIWRAKVTVEFLLDLGHANPVAPGSVVHMMCEEPNASDLRITQRMPIHTKIGILSGLENKVRFTIVLAREI
jgi:hypothetical protein